MRFKHRHVLGVATALLLVSSAWAVPTPQTEVTLPGNESFFQLMKEKLADAVSAERDAPFGIDAAKIKTALADIDQTYLMSKVNLMLPEGTSKDPASATAREPSPTTRSPATRA